MLKPMTVVVAFATAVLSSASFAHVENGALIDGSNNPVSSSYEKCVRVSSGRFSSKCQTIQPKKVAAPVASTPVASTRSVAPPVQEMVEEKVSLVGELLFAFDSSEISARGKAYIDSVVSQLAGLNSYQISLVGHTDSVGSGAYNQTLSERRARSVANYMISRQVKSSAISTKGLGESQPVASNNTAEGRAKNRRAEIMVDGTKVTYRSVGE